mgnify:CR=1 FL=1
MQQPFFDKLLHSVTEAETALAVQGLGTYPIVQSGAPETAGRWALRQAVKDIRHWQGIGLNVGHGPEDFPPELRERATSLRIASGRPPSRAASCTSRTRASWISV